MSRSNQNLNTSIRITYKNGETHDYSSIEECSEKTKISQAALKIRCNKSGKMADGTLYEWIDSHTKKSYQAKKSRNKGHKYELDVIKELTDLGYKGLVSSRSQNRNLDNAKIDIAETEDHLSCYVQCKATANIPNVAKINAEVGYTDRPLAIFWKKQNVTTGLKEFVIIPKTYFYNLLEHDKVNNK